MWEGVRWPSKWCWLSSSAPTAGLQAAMMSWQLHLSDKNCCTLYLASLSASLSASSLAHPERAHSVQAHSIREKYTCTTVWAHNALDYMKPAHCYQARKFANIHWSQVAVGLKDVASISGKSSEWRNPACTPGNCCLMVHMYSAMWFTVPCLPTLIKYKSVECPSWLAKFKAKTLQLPKMPCWGQPMALQAQHMTCMSRHV